MAKKDNPFVGIGASLGGIFIAVVAIVMIFASNQAWVLPIIAAAFAFLGFFLGFFQYKVMVPPKKK